MSWFPRIVNNLTLYDLTSGWIPCGALLTGLGAIYHRHNCHEHRCPRIVKYGQTHCKKHRDHER